MKSESYVPETAEDELMYLAGRIEAFAGYVRVMDKKGCHVNPEAAAGILGFELEESEKESASCHVPGHTRRADDAS